MTTEEFVTVIIIRRAETTNLILTLKKYQTYKQYPLDLYHREYIIAQRHLRGQIHQIWNNQPLWLNYTL